MEGWIKIYRSIQDHWVYQDPFTYWWWTDMLFLAAYKDKRVREKRQLVEVKRGQLVGSISYFKERWGTSKDKVIDFLKLLESDGMILKKTDRNVTIITICNYESYQDSSDNSSDNLSDRGLDRSSDTVPTQFRHLPEQKEEKKEEKEIYNNNSNAYTRVEDVSWEQERERGFVDTFIGQGSAIPFAKVTGRTPQDVARLLEVYMASRQLKGIGHRDFRHFVEAFKHSVQKNMITLQAPAEQPKKGKVVSGSDILNIYG